MRADTPQESMALAAGTRLGSYDVTALLGAGGMGEVYRAHDARLHRDVAIKVLPPAFADDPERLRRFEQEARAAAAISHPNILVVHDVGVFDPATSSPGAAAGPRSPYVVSELLEGETLASRLQQGPLPARRAIDYATQIALGLGAAHDKGILHRDLKPANLFVTSDGRVKILDFGLAKLTLPADDGAATVTADAITGSGVLLGTVGYMAPEQVRGQPVGPGADIFALGVVIHEMLSGSAPFRRDTMADTWTAILKDDPPGLPASASPALDRLVHRCLEKRPEDRFRSAHDLSLMLEALLGGSGPPVEATRDARASQVSRRDVLAGAAGLGLLGVGVGVGLGAALWRGSGVAALPSFHRLTFRRGMIRTARFAPDYQTILYGALWDGDDCRTYIVRPESPESTALNLPAASPLAVSSSGEVALSLGTHLRRTMPYGTLASVPMAGGAPRELLSGVKYADWSPDGRDLAAVRFVDGREVLEYPLGTVIAEPSTPGGGLSFPRVSPDGGRVACFETTAPQSLVGSVAIVDRLGDKRIVSPEYLNCFGLAWPGDEIWFTAADERPLFRDAVHAITPDGTSRVVARVPGNLSLHDVSPDGRFLLARTDDRGGIAALAAGDTQERDLSWLDNPIPGDIARDGSLIVFTEFGVGGGPESSVYMRSTTGSLAVRLGDGRPMALSPDSRWVLARPAVLPAPYMDLLPTGAGRTRRIEHPGVGYREARWLPDGASVIVLAQQGNQVARLYRLDLDDDALQPVTPDGMGIRFWALSPDGARVAVATDSGVELHPVAGGAPVTVPGLAAASPLMAWIDGGLLVNASSDPSNALGSVDRVDPVTGRRELWREIRPSDPTGIMHLGNLVVTPDGRSYAYFYFRALSDLYLVEGLR